MEFEKGKLYIPYFGMDDELYECIGAYETHVVLEKVGVDTERIRTHRKALFTEADQREYTEATKDDLLRAGRYFSRELQEAERDAERFRKALERLDVEVAKTETWTEPGL